MSKNIAVKVQSSKTCFTRLMSLQRQNMYTI